MTGTSFDSIADLMRADEAQPVDDDAFDTDLWLLLLKYVKSPEDAAKLGEAVLAYFSSRLFEWEVANGGFAQAAYNIPEWFSWAAWAYRHLGLGDAASLIDEAEALIDQGERRGEKFSELDMSKDGSDAQEDLGRLSQQFAESELNKLDERLDAVGFWANEHRLRLVRQNRGEFARVS